MTTPNPTREQVVQMCEDWINPDSNVNYWRSKWGHFLKDTETPGDCCIRHALSLLQQPTPEVQPAMPQEVVKRLATLEAIVAKLPKTADGVPITPGMKVWVPKHAMGELAEWSDAEVLVSGVTNYDACGCDGDGEKSFRSVQDDCHPECDSATPANEAYSSEDAAKKAAASQPAKTSDGSGAVKINDRVYYTGPGDKVMTKEIADANYQASQPAKTETKPTIVRNIDGKFATTNTGQIIKVASGEIIPENEPLILMRARDRLALPALIHYRILSANDGCKDYHFAKLDAVIQAFKDFAQQQPQMMKQPSVTEGKPFVPSTDRDANNDQSAVGAKSDVCVCGHKINEHQAIHSTGKMQCSYQFTCGCQEFRELASPDADSGELCDDMFEPPDKSGLIHCQLKRGHSGLHRNGNLSWSDTVGPDNVITPSGRGEPLPPSGHEPAWVKGIAELRKDVEALKPLGKLGVDGLALLANRGDELASLRTQLTKMKAMSTTEACVEIPAVGEYIAQVEKQLAAEKERADRAEEKLVKMTDGYNVVCQDLSDAHARIAELSKTSLIDELAMAQSKIKSLETKLAELSKPVASAEVEKAKTELRIIVHNYLVNYQDNAEYRDKLFGYVNTLIRAARQNHPPTNEEVDKALNGLRNFSINRTNEHQLSLRSELLAYVETLASAARQRPTLTKEEREAFALVNATCDRILDRDPRDTQEAKGDAK